MNPVLGSAEEAIARCRLLSGYTEEPGCTTRTFLCDPMHGVHREVSGWMERAGLRTRIDPAGNLRGVYPGSVPGAPTLYFGSHLDTVPQAGAFDGILGVVLAVSLVERLEGRPLPFAIEAIGFSEEEGVRFGMPFLGSRAVIGDLDHVALGTRDAGGVTVAEAISAFGLEPERMREAEACGSALGYFEIHIEQGPVLESLGLPLGVVETIVGQSRLSLTFTGAANHAGTTPMHLRRDALACASEWIGAVEREAGVANNLVATVGRIEAFPGAGNVIAGSATVSLDVRHRDDATRRKAVETLLQCAGQIATRRGLEVSHEVHLDQPAVPMDQGLTASLGRAVRSAGIPAHRMHSGAGHDAMILARRMPTAMLFLRSPGGISHHPDESVLVEDVAAAISAGLQFLHELEAAHG